MQLSLSVGIGDVRVYRALYYSYYLFIIYFIFLYLFFNLINLFIHYLFIYLYRGSTDVIIQWAWEYLLLSIYLGYLHHVLYCFVTFLLLDHEYSYHGLGYIRLRLCEAPVFNEVYMTHFPRWETIKLYKGIKLGCMTALNLLAHEK